MQKIFKLVRRTEIISLLVLVAISLMPFYWLRGGYIVLGHDAGLPISPKDHFTDRLETWTDRYEAGGDQTFALGGFFIHGFEAALAMTGLSLSLQQSIQFSIYILLMGLSMYLFCKDAWGRDKEILALSASIFYQVNHFILQGWFIAERTKFSLYIALPLLLLLLYRLFKTETSALKIGILSALIIFVFNGGGFLPLFAGTFISLAVWSFVLVVSSKEMLPALKKYAVYVLTFLLFSILLQMYWIAPYAMYVKNNFQAEVAQAGGTEGIINWVQSISLNTSYLNLFKLQGIQEWYVNEHHTYSKFYFSNKLLQLVAYSFALVFVLNIIKIDKKKREFQLACIGTAIISIFFMAGSHDPFGFIYLWMITHIPGFIAFRTPYYKFAPAFFVCFAPLLGYCWEFLLSNEKLKRVPYIAKLAIPALLICIYFFPFFTVNFFQYTHELSTKVKVPQYVFDYAKVSNSRDFPYQRTALIPGTSPENSVNAYSWGYWSLASLESLLDRHAYVSANYGITLNKKMVVEMYDAMRENDPVWENIADRLQVDSLLVQKDFNPILYQGVEINADSYLPAIQSSSRVKLQQDFGPWQLYSFERKNFPVAEKYVEVQDHTQQLGLTRFVNQLFPEQNVALSDKPLNEDHISKIGLVISPQCQDCLLQRTQVYFANPNVIVTPGSTLGSFNSLFDIFSSNKKNAPPVDTLQKLYVIQASFTRRGESSDRIPVWQSYQDSMGLYSNDIHSLLGNFKQTTTQNTLLQGYYNNLLFQLSTLKDISNLINSKDEADLFLNNVKTVKELITTIESKIVSTQIVHSNVFLADIQTPDQYGVYLFQPSLNIYQVPSQQKMTVHFKDRDFSTPVNKESQWVKMGDVFLEEGGQKITVDDVVLDNSNIFTPEIRAKTIQPEGMNLEFGASQPCSVIPMGELTSNRYNLIMEVKSNLGEFEPSFHIVTTDDKSPELPFWGVKQKVSDGSWKKIQLPFAGIAHKQYLFKVCDTSAKENNQISVRNLTLDRAVEPLLALVSQKTSSTATSSSVPEMSFTKEKNTAFEIEVKKASTGILRLPKKYNSYWLSSDASMEPVKIDGAFQGFYLKSPEENRNFKMIYDIQKYYTYAWGVTLAGLGVAILLLFASSKKYAKKSSSKHK